jgi:hypothetical protein
MNITRVASEKFPDSVVYEVADDDTTEPVWYLAVDRGGGGAAVYALDEEGEVNRIDSTILRYRTELPLEADSKGVLTFTDGDKMDAFLADMLGEHAGIVMNDLKIRASDASQTAMAADLTSGPEEAPGVSADVARYDDDLYRGLDPEVIDVIQAGERGAEGGPGGGAGPGGPGEGPPGGADPSAEDQFGEEPPGEDGQPPEGPPADEEEELRKKRRP